MQFDLLPELSPFGAYEKIITTVDVFPIYAFAYPVSNPLSVNTANVNNNIMTSHAQLPTLIITHKGSVFVCLVIHEVAETLGIYLKDARTKDYTIHWGPRTGTRHNQDFSKNGVGRI